MVEKIICFDIGIKKAVNRQPFLFFGFYCHLKQNTQNYSERCSDEIQPKKTDHVKIINVKYG